MADEHPIIRIAHTIIQQAIKDGASEVQVGAGPKQQRTGVTFVIKGVRRGAMDLPGEVYEPLIARYKEMADMNVEVQNAPQHGHIAVSHEGKDYNLDVHAIPTADGEQIAFTIQPKE